MLNHLTWQRVKQRHTKNDGRQVWREKWKFTFKTDDPAIRADVFDYLCDISKPFVVDYWKDETSIRFSETDPGKADSIAAYFNKYHDGLIGEEL